MSYLLLSVHEKLKYKSTIRKMKTKHPSYLILLTKTYVFFLIGQAG